MKKVCIECGEYKEHQAKGLCNNCYAKLRYKKNKENYKENYQKNKEEKIKYQREYDFNHQNEKAEYDKKKWKKPKYKKIKKKYRENNPEKINAQTKAEYNIKIPEGQLCERCNKRLAKDRHHPDYSKPLEVILLCKKCHSELRLLKN